MALRLSRASARLLTAGSLSDWRQQADGLETRLDAVLNVIYVVFNEGYAATSGAALLRSDLCADAIRLARRLRDQYPILVPDLEGLLALMLIQDSRPMAEGPPAALPMVDALEDTLATNHAWHAARADILRRLKRTFEAVASYRRARALTKNEVERRFFDRRIAG